MRKLALHWQIIIGLALGVIWALLSSWLGWSEFTIDWIKPWGTIFINLLKLIAVPLVLFSIIKGVSGISETGKLGRLGLKTIGLYLITTVIAVTVGLTLVNVFKPGAQISEEQRMKNRLAYETWAQSEGVDIKDHKLLLSDPEIVAQYLDSAEVEKQFELDPAIATRKAAADQQRSKGPLAPLVDVVPSNFFYSLSDNQRMLQVIFFAIFFGVTLLILPNEKVKPVNDFVDGVNEVLLKMVDIVMRAAPFFVFALLAGQIADMAGDDPANVLQIFRGLAWYSLWVAVGLGFLIFGVYALIMKLFVKNIGYKEFLRGIGPAQLLAFSSSSSAATLPVTMDCVRENLGVSRNVTSFVLPIGATVNMDGTSLYQAIAAVFLAQLHWVELSLIQQLTIVVTATMASIGAPAVPSAGLVMLIIVLESVGLNPAWIAIIFPVDRILDMLRTTVNVTGDATVSSIIAQSEGELHYVKKEEIRNFEV